MTYQQLENWFRNQRKKILNAGAPSARGAAPLLCNMFKIKGSKRRRTHQPIEIFQKQHKEEIDAALTAEGYKELNEEKMADELEDVMSADVVAHIKNAKSERRHGWLRRCGQRFQNGS
jgi:hypothetical protein